MDGWIKCILLTDSAEVIFIINNLSNISVNKTLSKMCLQNKEIPIKKGNRRWFTSMQYFYKKQYYPKCVYKTKHPDRNFWILKRVTGNFNPMIDSSRYSDWYTCIYARHWQLSSVMQWTLSLYTREKIFFFEVSIGNFCLILS